MSETMPASISILHLEDSPLDAELTAEILMEAGMGCSITRMVKLEEFQQVLEDYPSNFHWDMVLADYKMPGYDGMIVLNLLRKADPDLPFILLSGALGEELAVELLRNGATDYVLKHNLQRLPLVVRRAMAEHQIRLQQIRSQEEIRRARDDAEKANSAKGRFLGRISHELRTPLNAILGYTQLMQSDPMSEEQKHCTDQILKAGEHLLHLINEVLDITKIESGAFSVHISPTSVNTAIERAVDLVRPMAREARITIHVDSGPCELLAMVDRDRLIQVVVNLLTNAVKYNRPNGHVYVESQQEDSQTVKVLVRDTGVGISPEKIDRLFTPFDRLDAERDTKVPGTGLGLTVSKALVEAMGGTINVVSSEPDGTVFWLQLPVAPKGEDKGEGSDTLPALSVTAGLLPSCKILLVEDHEASRDFLERVFARWCNIELQSVTSVEAAMERLEQDHELFDAIITDLNFPGKSGEDLLTQIKQHDQLKHIPVIVTTIDVSPEREKMARSMGAADYFVKPIQINRFLQAVAEHCGRKDSP